MTYRPIKVRLDQPPTLDGDAPALVFTDDERMVLERGDVSYASWVLMAGSPPQADVDILVRA